MGTHSMCLTLPTDIVYVAGTVNGVETIFVQDEAYPVRWRAAVEVVEDGLYRIYLEMYDAAGNRSVYEDTVEYLLPWFVYDRTKEDVDRVKKLKEMGWSRMSAAQRQEWMKGMKGAFNLSDIKRNENNCYIIAGILNVPLITYRDNLPLYPDTAYFDNLLKNVATLREVGYRYADTPEVPEKPINTYQKVNDIEKILHDIYEVYNSNFSYYAGEGLYAGQETGLLL